MEGWLFQGLEKNVRHVGSHPISSSENTDTAQPFVGLVGKGPLHLPHLVHLDGLIFRLQDHNVRVEAIVDLSAREALVAPISCLMISLETVESLCKLKGNPFFPNPIASKKEITLCTLPRDNSSLKQLYRHGMSQYVSEGHDQKPLSLRPNRLLPLSRREEPAASVFSNNLSAATTGRCIAAFPEKPFPPHVSCQ